MEARNAAVKQMVLARAAKGEITPEEFDEIRKTIGS